MPPAAEFRLVTVKIILSEARHAGKRLDSVLAEILPQLSRSRLRDLIRQGCVTVDGRNAKPRQAVQRGAVVELHVPEVTSRSLEPEPMKLAVLHEDGAVLVLDKPSGLVVHPGAGHETGTLVHGLLAHCQAIAEVGDPMRPGIVHRLDKDTSGVMLVAKTERARLELIRQFSERLVKKHYLAVVQGRPSPESGRIESYLGRHPVNRQKMAVVNERAGKLAITEYAVLRKKEDQTALVECRLLTGRTHQIRVHLHALGHPLLGDEIYGRGGAHRRAARLMLHSWKLGFMHPADGTWMDFEAEIPAVFGPWLSSG